jgi:two-component system cell cycle sensor histidine kinase/response regulator CckA
MSTKELIRQNNRLRFLLSLANRLTSNLAPREMVRAVSIQIREVIQCDAVAISLPDSEGFFTVYSLELAPGKGSVEELAIRPSENDPGKQTFNSLKPVILTAADAQTFGKASKMVIAEAMKTLCFMPLANRDRARGVLSIARRGDTSFTQEDIEFLGQLTSVLATSLENSQLYRELQEREAKIRRLVDANIVGVFTWNLEGQIIDANDAFLRIVGYDREDLISRRIRWTDLTPREWLDRDEQHWVPELKVTGSLQPFEKEYFRKDGSRVPVLLGIARFEHSTNEGVAFVLDLTDRKRAEEELHAAETRFRAFVDHATDAFFVHDGSELAKVLDANRQACESLGYTREELIGLSPYEFDPILDAKSMKWVLERLDAGEIFAFETSHRRKDGTVFPVEVRVRPYWHGGSRFAISLARDITDRKRAEESLRRSEQMYSKLVSSLDGIVWQADAASFQFSYVSPQAKRILGYPLEQWLEPDFLVEHVHPEDAEWCVRFRKEAKKGHPDHKFEYRMIAADGRTVWLHDRINVQTEPDGTVCLRGVMIDVTARKRAEEALRKSEHLLQDIIDTSTAVIHVKDRRGQYLLINSRFEELFHVTREDIAGKTDYDLFPKDRADAFQAFDQQVLTAGGALETEEVLPHDDGPHTYISIKVPLRDEQGKPYAVCGISTDISERKRLQDQLREAQKMEAIGQLAGGIAHDFNNLTTLITGYSELLHAALANDPPLREKVDEIYKAGEQATSLTRQLLAFSRRQVVQPKVLDLNDVLGHMAKMLRRLLSENIDVKILPGAGACPIRCDPGQIQQVVMNLAINARDAMPNGGELLVNTQIVTIDGAVAQAPGLSAGSYVQLSVSDTGFGMDSETKAHIFEPFFTTKGVGKGTGLGLAMVHGILQQAGGSVTAESEVGKGTTFHLFFPMAKQPVEMSMLPGDRPAAVPLHGCETILLVEDQDGLRRLLTEILELHGYSVLSAADGQRALGILQARDKKIDLMITDLIMPQIGGRELVEQLPIRHFATRVLFMSGYADKDWYPDKARMQHAFIEKPFQPETLLLKIREILDQQVESRRSA